MTQTNLRVRISADLADIKQGLGLLRGELARVKSQADKSLGSNTSVLNGLRGMRSAVLGLAGALGAGLSAGGLIRISDEAKTLTARLKLATRNTQEFSRAQEGLFEISQRTRTGLAASIDLFYRLERSTRQLNLSQGTLLKLTETINKAGQIGGGGPAFEASLVQFGQALQAGDLSAVAQEMNSIQEQAPRLAEAIVKGLKELGFEGSNSLKKLVSEGGVQVQDILRAILTQVDEVDAEFAELPETISGGFTRIRNSFVQYIQASDQADSISASLAAALKAIAEHLPTLINAFVRLGTVVAAYLVTFQLLPGLYRALIGLSGGLATANTTLAASFVAAGTAGKRALLGLRLAGGALLAFFAGWQLGSFLREEFLAVELAGIALAQGLHKVAVSVAHYFQTAGPRIKLAMLEAFNFLVDVADRMNAAIISVLEKIPGRVGAAYAALRGKSKAFLDGLRADTSDVTAEVARLNAELARQLAEIDAGYSAQADAAIAAAGGNGGGTLDAGTGEVTLGGNGGGGSTVRGVVDQAELAADAITRLLAELDRQFEAREISVADYFRKRTELQLQAIDLAIAQARAEAEAATTTEAQSKALTQIVKLQRDRAEIGPRAAREQAKAEKELLEQRRQALFERGSTIMGNLRGAETSFSAQAEAGMLGNAAAEQEIQGARQTAIQQLQQLKADTLAYYAATKDPSVLPFLQELNGNIAQVAASQQKLKQQIADTAINALTNFFTDLATGAKTAKESLRDFVLGFVQGMAQIAARALATFLVLKVFDTLWPGFTKFLMSMGGAGVLHAGGIAGQSGRIRTGLSPLLFGLAPRYHAGGIAGLAPNEVPAVLERGEEVLTRQDPRHRANLRGGGQRPQRMIFVDDQRKVQDYLNSAEGEDAIVQVIGRNAGGVREVLA